MRIQITKTVSFPDGRKYNPGVVLQTSKDELKKLKVPAKSYRVITPEKPTATTTATHTPDNTADTKA